MPDLPPRRRNLAGRVRQQAAKTATALATTTGQDVKRRARDRRTAARKRTARNDELALKDKGETPIEAFGLHPAMALAPALLALLQLTAGPYGHCWLLLLPAFVLIATWVRSYVGGTAADTEVRRIARRLVTLSIAHLACFAALYAIMGYVGVTISPAYTFGGIAAAHTLLLFLEWREDRLILGQTQATHRIGFLNKDDQDVLYIKLTTTRVIRRWWMRPLNAGIVVLDSDADKETLAATYGLVRDPMRVRGSLVRAAKRARTTGTADPDDTAPPAGTAA